MISDLVRWTAANTHVDHFIPWARYPVDLGHNFVLADSRCNTQKRDLLPSYGHLESWIERNTSFGDQIRKALGNDFRYRLHQTVSHIGHTRRRKRRMG